MKKHQHNPFIFCDYYTGLMEYDSVDTWQLCFDLVRSRRVAFAKYNRMGLGAQERLATVQKLWLSFHGNLDAPL